MSGFKTVDTAIAPQQTVSVGLIDIVVLKIFFRVDAVVLGVILNNCPGQKRQISCRGHHALIGQAGGIKVLVSVHAQQEA